MYTGILNVYKEPGFTSMDVVAKLRGILHQKKIGHTGTLDPDAEGVLVVCLGTATKLCDILPDHDKEYEALLRLGITTDTEDLSGRVLNEQEVHVSEEEVRQVIASFLGVYDQIPPMYSAIKVGGKKLYELAREGKEIERKPRRVEIESIEVVEMHLPEVVIRVRCSRGTYIRSLCRDIGEKLGCGGCMAHLLRTRACGFTYEESLRLIDVERMAKDGTLTREITPIDAMYPEAAVVRVLPEYDSFLQNGNRLQTSMLGEVEEDRMTEETEELLFLVYDSKGKFRAIYRYSAEVGCLTPYKMFLDIEE